MFKRFALTFSLLMAGSAHGMTCDQFVSQFQKDVVEKEGLTIVGQIKLPPPLFGVLFASKLKTRVVALIFSPVSLDDAEGMPKTVKKAGTCTTPSGQTAHVYIDRPKVKQTQADAHNT